MNDDDHHNTHYNDSKSHNKPDPEMTNASSSSSSSSSRQRAVTMRGLSFTTSNCWKILSFLLVSLVFFAGNAIGSDNETTESYLVPYDESPETFVEYPQDTASQEIMDRERNGLQKAIEVGTVQKVSMNLWTTPIDFQHPLTYLTRGIVRRLDKDLLYFQPQYLLDDGAEIRCRLTDPVTGEEQENTANRGCRENCTNHGRYCAAELPKDPALAAKISGASIVEESLRRLCVWDVYGRDGGNNALHFYRYVDDPGFQQCDEPFGKNCTYTIMDKFDVGSHFIERCMNHTHGVEMDDFNWYLRDQITYGKELTKSDVPALKIGGNRYRGEANTAAIFRAVCAAYPPGIQPVVCDFCKDCKDVRYCLWFLQCDGTTFEIYATKKLNKEYLSEQGSSNSNSSNNNNSNNANDNGGNGGSTPRPTTPPQSALSAYQYQGSAGNTGSSPQSQAPKETTPQTVSPTAPTSGPPAVSSQQTPATPSSPTSTIVEGVSSPSEETTAPTSSPTTSTGTGDSPVPASIETQTSPPTPVSNNMPPVPTANDSDAAVVISQEKFQDNSLVYGVVLGLLAGLVVTFIYGCRDYQARIILHEITMEEGAARNCGTNALDVRYPPTTKRVPRKSFPPSGDLEQQKYRDDFISADGSAEEVATSTQPS